LLDHVRNSHDHSVLQSIDITRRNLMLILGLKGLSKGVFERRTSTGSKAFFRLIYLDATTFVLLCFFPLVQTFCLKILAKTLTKNEKKENFRLTCLAQKCCCSSSLIAAEEYNVLANDNHPPNPTPLGAWAFRGSLG